MVNIINSDLTGLFNDVKEKKLVIYGAGINAIHFIENYKLSPQSVYIVDKNKELTEIHVNTVTYPVFQIETLRDLALLEEIVILITTMNYYMEVLEFLDKMEELNGVNCYLLTFIREHCENREFSFSLGPAQIPKKIHYCWFGKNKMNKLVEECVDSWKRLCPDYEIVLWNEDNYDITKNKYMYQAFINQKYGFVPDYARLDIIYNEGGIYLDSDVKLLTSLDPILNDEMFFGLLYEWRSGFGLGFGAKKGHSLIKKLRDVYDDAAFINEKGQFDLRPCSNYQDPTLKEYGFSLKNEYQKINNVVCYPSSTFNPRGLSGLASNHTKNTISEHISMISWQDASARQGFEQYRRDIMKRINCQKV